MRWALALDHPTLAEPVLRVNGIMSRHVYTCRARDPLLVAAQVMWEHDCGCVPVLDDAGQLSGVITDRDIGMAAFIQGKNLHEMLVSSACSRELYTCHAEDLVVDAMETMARAQVRRLPVVDANGQLVGLLSLSDLIRHLLFARPDESSSESALGMGLLLEAVSRPRVTAPDDLLPMSDDEKQYLAELDPP
jgi:CBS domain-containing protein